MRPRLALVAVLPLLVAPLLVVAGGSPPASAAVPVSKTTLHFRVATGPDDRLCDVVGDLYVPADVTADRPGPAILATNGFGGSKNDQAYIATAFTQHGYVVLSYSGLGFGGSGCPITDDNPAYDGKAAKQLVSFLGGAPGIAFTTFNPAAGWSGPVPSPPVRKDTTAHDGTTGKDNPFDPRVGMIGGSYGGQIQFAAASVDPRIDTIIPLITWNDLPYSLAPGNGGVTPESLAPGQPGVQKRQWDEFFFALGAAAVAQQQGGNPLVPPHLEDATCPGFQPQTCDAQLTGTRGYLDPPATAYFHGSSVSSYLDKITIPTLLGQGEADSLFDLQEATANYLQLKARGVPAKMMWQSWGHSRIGPAKGENVNALDSGDATPLLSTYQGAIFGAWFDYYLKGVGAKPSTSFDYFRPWAYTGPAGGAASVAAAY
ncbi:MAG: CocE/NonD family hydrolase, partial [Actinomycetota bacterium]|nr:CocE/NonD family hydrolase [Actinomycetota bacterium]